ncbi:MAG: XrtN system VIT domain-containing protein [Leadbetterella sp.]
MNIVNFKQQSSSHKIAIIGNIVSSFTFLLSLVTIRDTNNPMFGNSESALMLFFVVYGISVLVFLNGFVRKLYRPFNFKGSFEKDSYQLLVVNQIVIGCYALNLVMDIFPPSSTWLSAIICSTLISHLVFSFIPPENIKIRKIIFFIMGFNLLVWIYYSIILIPCYPFSILGYFIMGITIHMFTPSILVFHYIKLFFQQQKNLKKPFAYGLLGFCLSMIGYFSLIVNAVSKVNLHIQNAKKNQISPDIEVAQKMHFSYLSQSILNSSYLNANDYNSYEDGIYNSFFINFMSGKSIDHWEHDPALRLYKLVGLPKLESTLNTYDIGYYQNKNLRSIENSRLWSGNNLSIDKVDTKINLFPRNRMTYTEKTIEIKNGYKYNEENTQEALFTFKLPDGASVTTLSLWINGIEQPAVLTTPEKAEKAYNTIVGVEQRDPAIVKWQVGNEVFLHVFPCTPKENRKVKIGFVAPLKKIDDQLVYENIQFSGPLCDNATEKIEVSSDTKLVNLDASIDVEEESPVLFTYDDDYVNTWELSIKDTGFENSGFEYNGKHYSMEEDKLRLENFTPSDVFFDLDKTWTKSEFEQLFEIYQNQKIWVWDTKNWQIINHENKNDIFDQYEKMNFGIFPIDKIKEPDHCLIITKNDSPSPISEDLKINIPNKENSLKYRVFSLKGINSLFSEFKEHNILNLHYGSIRTLKNWAIQQKYPSSLNDKSIVLEESGTQISESENSFAYTKGSDMIFRLYAYNYICQNYKTSSDSTSNYADLYNLAKATNVVSPISGLIVLETINDYEKFDIKNEGGLGNASYKKAGAVPEPHEWVIIICLGILLLVLIKKRKNAYPT